uniref:RING-type E3 ubiquitin transferase n=1 Tax=Dendroctonus ponderosae TaxID=77166 RepID=A0AAR5QHV1_DENPD
MDSAETSLEEIVDSFIIFMDKLTCPICSLRLTAFPIYVRMDGGVAVCGRCPLPNPTEYLRDKPYEQIIKMLQFPCRYKDGGCKELFKPSVMTRHERRCPHRVINCPASELLHCEWNGRSLDLKRHYQNSHPLAILSDRKYELDFTKNFSDIYLMPFETEIFLLRSQMNNINQIYNCSVEHVPTRYSAPFYKYSVTIETDNPDDFRVYSARHTDSQLLELKCISSAELEEDLPNAKEFIAHFQIYEGIVEDKQFDYPNDVTEEMKNELIDWAKLDGVKCQSCYGYLINPIQECPNNHILCLKCGEQSKCNLCQMDLEPSKNTAFVGLIDTLTYPCTYRDEGCMMVLKSIYIQEHESSCRFAYFDCPLREEQKCEVKCRLYETDRHITFNHSNNMLTGKIVEIDLQQNPLPFKKHFLIIHDGMVFKLIFKHEKETLMWSTVIVGSDLDAKKYNFEIEMIDKAGRDIGILSRAGCTPILEKEACFAMRNRCVLFLSDLMGVFIKENKLRFHVKIISAGNYYDERE